MLRLIVLMISSLALCTAGAEPQEQLSPLSATAAKSIGQVWMSTKTNATRLPVTDGMHLKAGTSITVDSEASLQLSLASDVSLTVSGGSFSIDKLSKNTSGPGRRMVLSLASGNADIRMLPGDSSTLLFTLNTPAATVNLQNADANISISPQQTELDVLRSTAKIQLIANDLKTIVFQNCRATANSGNKTLSIAPYASSGTGAMDTKPHPPGQSIAILSIQSSSVPAGSLAPISDFVADEIRRKSNTEVLFLDDVRALLRSEGMEGLLNCYTDSCISKIGSVIGVDMVVIGRIGQVGTQFVFDLKTIDVQRDRTLNRSNVSVDQDVGRLLGKIPEIVDRMVPDMQTVRQNPYAVKTAPSSAGKPEQNPSDSTNAHREEFIWLNGGAFTMGSNLNEGDMDETPRHTVTLSGFFIDRYEATRAQFEKTMGFNPSAFRGCIECPIDNITWTEASDFCKRRSMRLPTEAEWEYACRAGSTTTFATGSGISSVDANFDGSKPAGGAPAGTNREKPVPIGNFKPNAWGVSDMNGNVAEWVADWYDPNYYGNSDSKDPKGPASGKLRVVRGGSWKSAGIDLRSSNRSGLNPELKFDNLGVRCVKTSTAVPKPE